MSSIVGYWQNDINDARWYEFKSNGTFESNVPNKSEYTSRGTYVLKGSELECTWDGKYLVHRVNVSSSALEFIFPEGSVWYSRVKSQQEIDAEKRAAESARIEREKQEAIGRYDQLIQEMNKASTESEFQHLTTQFRNMGDYKDANRLANECANRQKALEQQRMELERRKEAAEKAQDNLLMLLQWGLCAVFIYILFGTNLLWTLIGG